MASEVVFVVLAAIGGFVLGLFVENPKRTKKEWLVGRSHGTKWQVTDRFSSGIRVVSNDGYCTKFVSWQDVPGEFADDHIIEEAKARKEAQ